jgi:hypothetical protein
VLLSYVGEVDNYILVNNLKLFLLEKKVIYSLRYLITQIELNLLEKIHEWVLGPIGSLI